MRGIVFINEYLIDRNAKRAAIGAGYSEKTAYAAGSRLLNHVEVQTALQARKDELAKTYGLVLEAYVTTWKQIQSRPAQDVR